MQKRITRPASAYYVTKALITNLPSKLKLQTDEEETSSMNRAAYRKRSE